MYVQPLPNLCVWLFCGCQASIAHLFGTASPQLLPVASPAALCVRVLMLACPWLCCLFLQVLSSATEAAEMILRVDDIIKAAPRQRQ